MRHIRKTTALLLALCLLFALGACGNGSGSETEQQSVPASGGAAGGDFDFPDIRFFTATTLEGEQMEAEDLFGDYDVTVINFWATWCPPCLSEMDDLAGFQKTLPENVQMILFCIDGQTHEEECRDILADCGYEGLSLVDGDGDMHTLLNQMQYIPTTLFVDSRGGQLSDGIVGASTDLANAYKEQINAGLKAQSKSEWK